MLTSLVQDACDPDLLFAATAFRDIILGPDAAPASTLQASAAQPAPPPTVAGLAPDDVCVVLAVRCHRMLRDETLCVVPVNEDGHEGAAVDMSHLGSAHPDDDAEWRTTLTLPRAALPLAFRFGIRSHSRVRCETGAARMLASPEPVVASRHVAAALAHCGHVRHPEGPWRGAGIAVPVFSLRSRQSVGCGDFGDLCQLVQLAATCGLRCVQVLPVNDTRCDGTWRDSYPYSCASTAALHPLYLRVQAMGLSHGSMPAHIATMVQDARAQLDSLQGVDYEATLGAKLAIARAWFDVHTATGGALTAGGSHHGEFNAWCEQHAHWVRPYAVFCFLKDVFGTSEHWTWGALAHPTAADLERLASGQAAHGATAAHLQFTAYIQWHLHRQLGDAAAVAASCRVVLKGDLPIGVDKRSLDTWLHPQLFRMTASAGAPPDAFDPNGQNWGFPTYVWPAMAEDGNYAWWRTRLHSMRQFFSALRVDHVLGFFRIWELPASCASGLLGRFRPAEPLTRLELERCGLWDILRLVMPHIRRHTLVAAFGSGTAADDIAAEFLDPVDIGGGGEHQRWAFKPAFATELGLLAAPSLQTVDGCPTWVSDAVATKRACLLTLLRNVCLLRDQERPEECFHPRFDMRTTSSFAELEGWQQDALWGLSQEYWHSRQDKGWRAHARATLPPLQAASGMLICGEDLGLVPPCVPPVMRDLGVLSLRIQRMPPASAAGPYDQPSSYPHSCVCSPSCHDVTTTRAWWEEDAQRRMEYAAQFLPHGLGGDYARAYMAARDAFTTALAAHKAAVEQQQQRAERAARGVEANDDAAQEEGGDDAAADGDDEGDAPEERDAPEQVLVPPLWSETEAHAAARQAGPPPAQVASPELMRTIVAQHLASPAALAIFPIQDVCALDADYCASVRPETELINDPTVKRHYWRYRMRDSLEALGANEVWVATMRQLVEASARDAATTHA